ncbi:hypothetical protein LTR78_010492 [Recurvomyces mirabilis]|uniref:DDHD domain-containing protein n=1 Tax=Recurvomyces mirabilis TaxID=574656 RepID=A0AAE0TMF2_9PEZI|nr:hypothetical protein LTR78_010492 [Recurvomyces mirabilis]KAK5151675.1 hypothetical protein LTS14_009162 [Recurvomyces mirabilis]
MTGQDNAASQSYLSRLSPWSKSPVVPPSKGKEGEPEPTLQQQKGADHAVTHKHRLSLRRYPRDCPPVRPCWFHAVDIPKRRPHPAAVDRAEEKPAAQPKKYAAFSITDSKAIEAAFQRLIDEEDDGVRTSLEQRQGGGPGQAFGGERSDGKPNTSLHETGRAVKVPVNEDYLFDVDVGERELAPAYWLGPVYNVRRGTWFYQDGATQRPCDENLAAQLEEGYLKVKAWRLPTVQAAQAAAQKPRSVSQGRARPVSWTPGQETTTVRKPSASTNITPHASSHDLRAQAAEQATRPPRSDAPIETGQTEQSQNTYRLFGAHMSSVVTYQDDKTAWLLTDDFMSRMNYSMYQRFAGGGHFAGMKMTRGYINPETKLPEKDGKTDTKNDPANPLYRDISETEGQAADGDTTSPRPSQSETRRQTLQRHMSSLLESPAQDDPELQDEEVRRRDEREIEDDYREAEGEEQGREIEHLILVTHGIGQRLGLRLESVNFVHDVNTLRKTLKAVYAESPDLRALNAELGDTEHVNSRVQVLPICWRHLLDFPKHSLKQNRKRSSNKEQDLADTDDVDDEEYPSLEDLTVDGVPAVRNLITDLALDILLYQSPAYKDHISRIVLEECNRIYHLFIERNPNFNGKISLIGHSLGSAIMFDILCRQGNAVVPKSRRNDPENLRLDFEVEDFYALGSPIGLFSMLKGRKISAREGMDAARRRAMTSSTEDPMLDAPPRKASTYVGSSQDSCSDILSSSPKCSQIFNIFHPTDPISYRIEPLISPAMASLKPQPLPYTKRGIFGAPMGQGLTGIGARVSQSVSSMWSSMASSLLTRGLGYSGTEPLPLPTGQAGGAKSSGPLSMSQGAGTNVAAGVVGGALAAPEVPEITPVSGDLQEKLASDALAAGERGQHPPTLIDAELETLYGGYQKRRKSVQSDAETRDLAAAVGSEEWREAEERARKLRREEEKVRRLNSNGRVDYAIQEGVFDINLIAAIASHLSYWSDEDVSHFVISQLLSRHRVVKKDSRGDAAKMG